MLEDRSAEHGLVVDKYVDITDNYSMTTRDYVVRATLSAGKTLTLPSVVDAKGRFYSVRNRTSATNALTVKDRGDSEAWTDVTVAATKRCLFYSDGILWHYILQA
jgi:hypothetical protein